MLFKHKDKATGNIVPDFQITTIFDKQISCNIKKKATHYCQYFKNSWCSKFV